MTRIRVATAGMLAVAAYGAVALPAVATSGSGAAAQSALTEAYGKGPTVSCLRGKGAAVTAVTPANRRLRALRDLAQKTSWQAKLGGDVVGVAIGRSAGEAAMLVDLLRIPNDRYRIERRDNAVLLYAPASADLAQVIRGCLA
jgi:hypothetical protein